MGIKDFFITPIYLLILYLIAYSIRPLVTDQNTRRYFIPGLTVKFIGAIALGMIYQFYYGGGDTFTYFQRGSNYIWNAFLDSPFVGLQMIFSEMVYTPENFEYTSQIYTFGDSASYFVVRVAGFFDLLTFHAYSATALLFAVTSYSGIWMIFLVFYKFYPSFIKHIALGVLFVPSVFFWGSGLMKDTLTLGALGWLFYGFSQVFIFKKKLLKSTILLIVGFYVLYTIKIYIVICFMPALAFYFYLQNQSKIKNQLIKTMLAPFLISLGIASAYFTTVLVSANHYRYSIDTVLYTAEQTAKWNYFVSERDQGSGYTLGDYDFTPTGLARKFVPAVITSFFRPFLWEVRNPVMLLSALENTFVLYLFVVFLFQRKSFVLAASNPLFVFCLIFAVLFAFAIGVTTYNFGSLVRYKIPMIPFLMTALLLITNKKFQLQSSHV
ncbi:hypothetical protein [Reichenbachiella sp. MALMAid0571]|uniref:hypothetical protein n=1 Tax=Reichenbachiella sp. MALMAid0571 TaxID=3143939 RepID=UPI0032E04674